MHYWDSTVDAVVHATISIQGQHRGCNLRFPSGGAEDGAGAPAYIHNCPHRTFLSRDPRRFSRPTPGSSAGEEAPLELDDSRDVRPDDCEATAPWLTTSWGVLRLDRKDRGHTDKDRARVTK